MRDLKTPAGAPQLAVAVASQVQHKRIAAARQPDSALDTSPLAVIDLAPNHTAFNTPSHAAQITPGRYCVQLYLKMFLLSSFLMKWTASCRLGQPLGTSLFRRVPPSSGDRRTMARPTKINWEFETLVGGPARPAVATRQRCGRGVRRRSVSRWKGKPKRRKTPEPALALSC